MGLKLHQTFSKRMNSLAGLRELRKFVDMILGSPLQNSELRWESSALPHSWCPRNGHFCLKGGRIGWTYCFGNCWANRRNTRMDIWICCSVRKRMQKKKCFPPPLREFWNCYWCQIYFYIQFLMYICMYRYILYNECSSGVLAAL